MVHQTDEISCACMVHILLIVTHDIIHCIRKDRQSIKPEPPRSHNCHGFRLRREHSHNLIGQQQNHSDLYEVHDYRHPDDPPAQPGRGSVPVPLFLHSDQQGCRAAKAGRERSYDKLHGKNNGICCHKGHASLGRKNSVQKQGHERHAGFIDKIQKTVTADLFQFGKGIDAE